VGQLLVPAPVVGGIQWVQLLDTMVNLLDSWEKPRIVIPCSSFKERLDQLANNVGKRTSEPVVIAPPRLWQDVKVMFHVSIFGRMILLNIT
jgi:hypothetical protein